MLAKVLLLVALKGAISQTPPEKFFDAIQIQASRSGGTPGIFMYKALTIDESDQLCNFDKQFMVVPSGAESSPDLWSDGAQIRFDNRFFGLFKYNLGFPILGTFDRNIPPLAVRSLDNPNSSKLDTSLEKQIINPNATYSQAYIDFGNGNVRFYDPATQESLKVCTFNKSYAVIPAGQNKTTFSVILADFGSKYSRGGLTLSDPKSGIILNVAKKFALLPPYALKPYTPPAPTPDLKKEMQRTQQAEQKSKSHQQFVSKFQSRGNKK